MAPRAQRRPGRRGQRPRAVPHPRRPPPPLLGPQHRGRPPVPLHRGGARPLALRGEVGGAFWRWITGRETCFHRQNAVENVTTPAHRSLSLPMPRTSVAAATAELAERDPVIAKL